MNLQAEPEIVSDIIVYGIKSISFEVIVKDTALLFISFSVKIEETSLPPGESTVIKFHNVLL